MTFAAILRADLFQRGDFTLNSGARSPWKIECDSLTGGDIDALAVMIHQIVLPFGRVVGVPRGGVRLADELEQYATEGEERVLIVDDVLTTGGSMARFRATFGETPTIGAVVFARGNCPGWISPVFRMPSTLWVSQ